MPGLAVAAIVLRRGARDAALERAGRVADNAGMTHRLPGLGLAALLLACGGSSGPPPPAPPPASQPAAAPAAAPAARTTIRGVARNAKGGAVVVTATGPVYVLGLEAWPAALDGRAVEVTGVVRQKKHLPDPVGPGGTVAQGAWGSQTVIADATWKAAP
jgi:hypothetical protein